MNNLNVATALEHIDSMVEKGRPFEACFARVCAALRLSKDERRKVRERYIKEQG